MLQRLFACGILNTNVTYIVNAKVHKILFNLNSKSKKFMKLTLLTAFALSLCAAAFALSGSGTEENPFFLYGEDVYNKDVVISQSGCYESGNRMNSLMAMDGGDYKFIARSVVTGSFTNLGHSLFSSTTLQVDSGDSNFGNLTEFVGSSASYGASFSYKANGSISGTALFYNWADFSVVDGYNLENLGSIRFLDTGETSAKNDFLVALKSSFINKGLVEVQRGTLDLRGNFTNEGSLSLSANSELYLRGSAKLSSTVKQGLNIYNLYTESASTLIQTSAETLQINNYAHIEGSLDTAGNLLLNDGEFTLRGSCKVGGDIVLSNASVDFVGGDIKTSDGALLGLVLAEGTKNTINYLNYKLEFASLELNGADLILDALNPFIVNGEAWGSGDYHLIINNFTEGRVFIGSLDEDFDLSRVTALDGDGNDLGEIFYVNGYLSLVPEASTYALIFGIFSLSLVGYRRCKSRAAA